MAAANLFYPPQDVTDSLSVREQEQLSLVIGSNLIFMILFAIFGVVMFLFKLPLLGAGSLILLAFFTTSLTLIKKGNIHKGAWTTTAAIAVLSAVVCFGAPFQNTNFLPYRDSCFLAVMAVCNYVISLRRKQLYSFFAFSALLWLALNAAIYNPLYQTGVQAAVMNIIICSLGIFTTNVSILLYDRFTRRVVSRAAENEEKSAAALKKISAVLDETKEGLNIGKLLSASTEKAAESVEEIRKLYAYINKETVSLSSEAVSVKDTSVQINGKAEKMKSSVQEQSVEISRTSAALTQMSASLNNISDIATQQRSGMDKLVHNLDSQMLLLQKLVDDVNLVKESSVKVSAFVDAVNQIASQTGLLAMNASIEAAHAGTLGKGFSVIAQEIRKLSDETSKNAQKITETLSTNAEIVNTTTESVTSFSDYTKTTTEELRKTIHVMEEILAGISEIDAGTNDVMQSITHIVDDSSENSRLAEGVAEEIIRQNSVLQNISNGTEQLKDKVSSLEDLLANIRNAIDEIDTNASANEQVAAKISDALK